MKGSFFLTRNIFRTRHFEILWTDIARTMKLSLSEIKVKTNNLLFQFKKKTINIFPTCFGTLCDFTSSTVVLWQRYIFSFFLNIFWQIVQGTPDCKANSIRNFFCFGFIFACKSCTSWAILDLLCDFFLLTFNIYVKRPTVSGNVFLNFISMLRSENY